MDGSVQAGMWPDGAHLYTSAAAESRPCSRTSGAQYSGVPCVKSMGREGSLGRGGSGDVDRGCHVR